MQEYRRQGLSISAIGALTGYDRKTIRKYLKASSVGSSGPQYGPREDRPSKLEPFKPYLQQRLAAGVWNASVLLRELRDLGYAGGQTILGDYLRPQRDASRAQIAAVRRFETAPGRQGQVDWGDLGTVETVDEDGVVATQRLSALVLTLGHSRAMFATVTTDQKLASFLRAHEAAFQELGGVPQEILYDRCKTVVLRTVTLGLDDRGEIRWHPTFLDFARYWGFAPRLCRAYRPQTKGKVENGIKYLRGNFLVSLRSLDEAGQPGWSVRGVNDVRQRLSSWLAEVANVREHGTTHRRVDEAWADERAELQPIGLRPAYALPEPLLERRQVTRDCFVSYRGNRYSAPWVLAGQEVAVREDNDRLEIYDRGQPVAIHLLSHLRHQVLVQQEHLEGMPYNDSGPGAGGKERLHLRLGAERAGAERAGAGKAVPVVEHRPLQRYEELLQADVALLNCVAADMTGTGTEGLRTDGVFTRQSWSEVSYD
jgi:transposase